MEIGRCCGRSMPTPETADDSLKRLRPIPRIALVLFCLISLGVSARQDVGYFVQGPVYSDFRIFMTGIALVQAGHGSELYQFRAQDIAQRALYPATRLSGLLPFNHLAFELLLYWPLAFLPYHIAIAVWAVLNLGVIWLIAWLLNPYTRAISDLTGIPIWLFLLAFYPVVYVLGEGQDSLIFLLLILLSLRAMDADREFLAGVLLALGCFKLHLALLLGLFILVLGRKWKGLAGFAMGGAAALGVSLLMVGPNLFRDYLNMLRKQEVMTPWGFFPWYMPNFRGFFRWTLGHQLEPGQILPVVFMTSVIVAIVAGWLIVRRRIAGNSGLLYSASVLTTILISYHLHVQDLSMAALPMLVVTDWAIRHRITQSKLLPAWITALAISIAVLYLYRIAAEPFWLLLFLTCYLAAPVFLLWIVAFRALCESRELEAQAA